VVAAAQRVLGKKEHNMQAATAFLTKDELTDIEQAVATAESKTSVEIVPVLASVSGRYDRAEDLAGLWLGILLMVVLWIVWPVHPPEPGDWGASLPLNYLGWIAALVGGFLLGAWICARTPLLRRLLTPRQELAAEVQRRAREVFFDQRIHHTSGGTGVLIYVSVFERTVCILADETAIKALPDGEIARLCSALTRQLGQSPASGLKECIASLGDQLAGPLPRDGQNRDELGNAVVLID
jgi:putative membrane protein